MAKNRAGPESHADLEQDELFAGGQCPSEENCKKARIMVELELAAMVQPERWHGFMTLFGWVRRFSAYTFSHSRENVTVYAPICQGDLSALTEDEKSEIDAAKMNEIEAAIDARKRDLKGLYLLKKTYQKEC